MRKYASLSPEVSSKRAYDGIQSEKPVVELLESPGRITVTCSFPGFYFVDDERTVDDERLQFSQIEIADIGYLSESGKPMLPSFGRYIQIPFDADYKVSVQKDHPVVFENVSVSPAQRMQKDGPDVHKFEFDRETYASDAIYPKEIVNVAGPFDIDNYHALLLSITPFQYNPASKSLTGYGKITVTLDLKEKKGRRRAMAAPSSGRRRDKAAFGNLLLNPGSRIEKRLGMSEMRFEEYNEPYNEPMPVKEGSSPRLGRREPSVPGELIRQSPELLIIYYDGSPEGPSFQEPSRMLAEWKNKRGIVTTTLSDKSIGATVSDLKKFIREQKTSNPDLGYVLLFGDSDMIKSELIIVGGDNVITDHYYSTATDPKGPKNYLLPWLSIGRIPVRTEAEGMAVVHQIISYEREPPQDPGYYRRMTFAAEFEDPDGDGREDEKANYVKTMEEIRSSLLPLGFEIERVYVTWPEGSEMRLYNNRKPVPEDARACVVDEQTATEKLIAATSEGRLFIGHRDHGNIDGWLHPKFGVSQLDEVKGEVPTIFYSVNCATGKFDVNPVESFAEKNLRIPGGAPSLIAASRNSWTLLNNELAKALFDATFAGVIPTYPSGSASMPLKGVRLGDILNYAKSYLPMTTCGSDKEVKEEMEIYHVIGDPTLEVWTALPKEVQVAAGLRDGILDIQMSECPAGSILTVWMGEKMIRRIEPSATHITVSLDALPSGRSRDNGEPEDGASVCFSAPGCRYAEVKAAN